MYNSDCFSDCSSSNIGEFSKDVRMLAALEETESDGDKLLEAARRLAGAFSELLTAAQPGSAEVSIAVIMLLLKFAKLYAKECLIREINFLLSE